MTQFYNTITFFSDDRLSHMLAFVWVVGVVFRVMGEEGVTHFHC